MGAYYQIANKCLFSDIPLPCSELLACPEFLNSQSPNSFVPAINNSQNRKDNPDIYFTLPANDKELPKSESINWYHSWVDSTEENWLNFGRSKTGEFVLEFPNFVTFSIQNNKYLRAYPKKAICIETISHLLLDQVVPLLLNQQGSCVLHSSVIEIKEKAIAFIGETGSGKSTISAEFCRQGYRMISEDFLCLNIETHTNNQTNYYALPGYPSIRLWDNYLNRPGEIIASYTNKKRYPLNKQTEFSSTARKLSQIYLLNDSQKRRQSEEWKLKKATPLTSVMTLVKNSFQLDIENRDQLNYNLDIYCKITEDLEINSLSLSKNKNQLSKIVKETIKRSR